MRIVFTIGAVSSLAGCALHPVNLSPKPAMVADDRSTEMYSIFHDGPEDVAPWWDSFQSAGLDALVRRALAENFDIEAATERLNQAKALYRLAGGAGWPAVNVAATVDHDISADGRALRKSAWEIDAALAWEVDLFKRLRSRRLSRAAEVEARIQQVRAARLALSVAVAEAFYAAVEQRLLLALLAKQRQASVDLLRIIERRYEQGLVSRLDVLQQQTQLADVESQIPATELVMRELEGQLGSLLGALPAGGGTDLNTDPQFPALPALVALGRPDDVLRNRPDLRVAQAELVAADAEIARALAERLPRFTFSASSLWFEGRAPEGNLVTLGAELMQPLLDWGQRRAEWVRTKAVYRERLASFSQAYIRAVWSVQTLAGSESKQRDLLARLEDRKKLLDATLQLATSRYTSGLTDYLPVLSAMQQLYALEQRLLRERRRLTSLRIALHQTLGGPVPSAAVMEN